MAGSGQKTLVVVNPHSANGSTGRAWPSIREELRRVLGAFDEHFTQGSQHATELVREGLLHGADRVIAVGGDGTNNEVVNGFYDGARPIRKEAVLGFVPRGTGGDFRKTSGVGKAIEECLPVLAAGHVRAIDLGTATFVTGSGEKKTRLFINITSFGIGGQVDANVNRSSKALGGKVSFFIGTLKAMASYTNRTIHLKVDGVLDESMKIKNVAVANGQYFGGGMWVAPQAVLDDGLFDVVILGDLSRSEMIFKARDIYRGVHLKWPKVRSLRGKHVEADSNEEVLIDMDGEQPGRLPITLDVLPAALKILAPA